MSVCCPSRYDPDGGRNVHRRTPSSWVWVVVRAAGTNQPALTILRRRHCGAGSGTSSSCTIVSLTTTMSRRLLLVSAAAAVVGAGSSDAFAPSSAAFAVPNSRRVETTTTTSLSMVLEKPVQKKLAKIEELKIASDHLVHPLLEVRCRSSAIAKNSSCLRSAACYTIVVRKGSGRRRRRPLPWFSFYASSFPSSGMMEYHSFPVGSIHADDHERPRPISQWTFWGEL
jgi:hypothetical protein